MYKPNALSYQKPGLGEQAYRLSGVLDVILHLFPESSDRFEYDDEILTLICVARDLAQDVCDQVTEEVHVGSFRSLPLNSTAPEA